VTRASELLAEFRSLPHDERLQLARQLAAEVASSRERTTRDYVWFLESLDRVNRGMQSTADVESMMSSVLDTTLQLFECDRAWLIAQGKSGANAWRVVMEHTQPDSPGAFTSPLPQRMDPASAEAFRVVLAAGGPVLFGPGYEHPVPEVVAARFRVQSQVVMALFPKGSEPYLFGLHQCSDRGPWSEQERRLFEEIGRRLTDALTGVLVLRSLRESERRLDAAQALAHVGYWERDMTSGEVALSDESCRIFGFDPEERTVDLATWHERWLALLDPRDRAPTGEAYRIALSGGPPYEVEYRIIRAGGEVRTIHSRGHVIWGEDGRPERVFGVMQDITELRKAELALRASESRFRAIVEHAADAFLLFDQRLRVVDVNRRACDSLGYSRAELVGKHARELAVESEASAMEQLAERVWTGDSVTLETEHRHKDGSTFPVEIRAARVDDGAPHLLALVRDVTARKQLDDRLRQTQKLEAVGRLAGGVAHDFNNLLTVINSCADLALLEASGATVASLLSEIHHAGVRAASLTRQLLAFSRQQVLDAQVVDLNRVLENIGTLLERVIGADIELSFQLDPSLGLVKVDAGQFEQAIVNLAVNARDALPEGGSLRVRTSNVELGDAHSPLHPDLRAGRYAMVTVSDSGQGMEPAIMARIFEPFFTTKPVGKGTGLGLAMVYGFIKQSGGHIEVESRVGSGTSFRLYLPWADEPLGVTPPRRSRPHHAPALETILLVEDDDAVRRVCRRVLTVCGYRVLEARNGEEALALVTDSEVTFQLLLTDLIMPRMGGRQLATKLRERAPSLRILFMSGYTEDVALVQALDGGVAFLQKPFTQPVLVEKVRALLDADLTPPHPSRTTT
jgi:two-component system, cell cycle sensor histidine kinase and response regulator CckA